MRTNKKTDQLSPEADKIARTAEIKTLEGTDNFDFPIVGIGASAGGLEALEQFFGNMPKNNGMAFVVIQHLDPDHVGIMPELLQRITDMEVLQATDRLNMKPNCLYVIPPNKSMSLLNGKYDDPANRKPGSTNCFCTKRRQRKRIGRRMQ